VGPISGPLRHMSSVNRQQEDLPTRTHNARGHPRWNCMNDPFPLALTAGQKMPATYPRALVTRVMRPQSPYLGGVRGCLELLPLWLERRKTLTDPTHQSHSLPASWWQATETALAAASEKGDDWKGLVSSQSCQEGWRIGSNWGGGWSATAVTQGQPRNDLVEGGPLLPPLCAGLMLKAPE